MLPQRARLRPAVRASPDLAFVRRAHAIHLPRADPPHLVFDRRRQRQALARPRQPHRQERLQPHRPRVARRFPDRRQRPDRRRPIPTRAASRAWALGPPLRAMPRPDERLAVIAGDRDRFGQQPAWLPPRVRPHIPIPRLRQIRRCHPWSHADARLRHTGFGHTLYGATMDPSVTLSMARYVRLIFGAMLGLMRLNFLIWMPPGEQAEFTLFCEEVGCVLSVATRSALPHIPAPCR